MSLKLGNTIAATFIILYTSQLQQNGQLGTDARYFSDIGELLKYRSDLEDVFRATHIIKCKSQLPKSKVAALACEKIVPKMKAYLARLAEFLDEHAPLPTRAPSSFEGSLKNQTIDKAPQHHSNNNILASLTHSLGSKGEGLASIYNVSANNTGTTGHRAASTFFSAKPKTADDYHLNGKNSNAKETSPYTQIWKIAICLIFVFLMLIIRSLMKSHKTREHAGALTLMAAHSTRACRTVDVVVETEVFGGLGQSITLVIVSTEDPPVNSVPTDGDGINEDVPVDVPPSYAILFPEEEPPGYQEVLKKKEVYKIKMSSTRPLTMKIFS